MTIETRSIDHRGFTIFWQMPKPMGQTYPVQISTPDIELRTRLGIDANQTSQTSFDDAVAMAKGIIDGLLDGMGPEETAY